VIKETIVLAALALGQTPSVTDGDTVRIAGVSIRLTDYDSPELHARCPKELELALAAKHELERVIGQGQADPNPLRDKELGTPVC
jgi:endonuclease YncB( thermonuclease family)